MSGAKSANKMADETDVTRDRGVLIRDLQSRDIPVVTSLISSEGWWIRGTSLADMMDSKSVIKVASAGGHIIGCCCISVASSAGLLLWYIVDPSHRGQGTGPRLWDAAISATPDNITLCLHSVERMIPKYQSMGFTHGHIDYIVYNLVYVSPLSSSSACTVRVLDKEKEDVICSIHQYDETVCPIGRQACIRRHWQLSDRTVYGVDDGGAVFGIACIDKDSAGIHHLSPVYAMTDSVAISLLAALLQCIPLGSSLTCHTLINNAAAQGIWQSPHFRDTGRTRTGRILFNAEPPEMTLHQVYAMAGVHVPFL